MSERSGVCGSCGSRFKVPATFQGTKAKCSKCGGVVEVAPAAAGAAAPAKPAPAPPRPAPKAASPAAPAAAPRRPASPITTKAPASSGASQVISTKRAGSASGVRKGGGGAGAGRASRAGAGRHAAAGAAARSNTPLIAGIGAAVIAAAAGIYFFTKGGDEPAATAANAPPVAAAPVAPPAAATSDLAASASPDPATAEPEKAPEPEKPPEPAPSAEPAPVEAASQSPVIAFEPFPRLDETSENDWVAVQDAVRKAYIESSRPKDMKEAKKAVAEAGVAAIPALINGLNGLDVSDGAGFQKATTLVLAIQELSFDVIPIPFKTDVVEMEANMAHNVKVLTSLRKYWSAKIASEGEFAKFKQRLAEAREKMGPSEGG